MDLNYIISLCVPPSSKAIGYLKSRGLTEHSIKHFKIGEFTHSIGKRLISEGINLHQDFRNMIIFPVIVNGDVKHFTARAIGNDYKTTPHKHLRGHMDFLYNHDAIKRQDIFICESPIDCITLWQNGFNAVAKLGKGPIRDEIIQEWVGKNIYICYDTDYNQSGQQASKKLAQALNRFEIKPKIITLPLSGDKTDINSFFQSHEKNDFIELIYEAKTYYKPSKKRRINIESKLNIMDIVDQYFDHPIKTMQGYQVKCPFHDDRSPSMHIYTATNTAFCFAGCGVFSAEKLLKQLKGK